MSRRKMIAPPNTELPKKPVVTPEEQADLDGMGRRTRRRSKDERIEDAKDMAVAAAAQQPRKHRPRGKRIANDSIFTAPLPHKLSMRPCPCGRCDKYIVEPLFFSQDASIYKEQADEIVKRYNGEPSLKTALNQLIDAWERIKGQRVEGGHRIKIELIVAWLSNDMKPAIDHARKAVGRLVPDIGA